MKLLCLLVVFAVFFPVASNSTRVSDQPNSTNIHNQFSNISLVHALKEISKQTGYKFDIPEEWGSTTVLGTFVQVDIHDFFKRVLKGYNFVLIFDDLTQTVIVRDFGNSSGADFTASGAENNELSTIVDPESGLLKEDLKKLHANQLKEMQLLESNPDAIDFMSGLTRLALQELNEQQVAEQKQVIQDGNAMDPMSGLTHKALQELYEQQIAGQKQATQEGSAIDPISGLPIAELKRLREQQLAEYGI